MKQSPVRLNSVPQQNNLLVTLSRSQSQATKLWNLTTLGCILLKCLKTKQAHSFHFQIQPILMAIPTCPMISSSSLPVKKLIASTLVTELLMSLLVIHAGMALKLIIEIKGIVMSVLMSLRLSNSKFSKFARSARFLIHKI